jgi:hypothetical protein
MFDSTPSMDFGQQEDFAAKDTIMYLLNNLG